MKLMYSLLTQVYLKAGMALALPPLWTRLIKQKYQCLLEAEVCNGDVYLDSTELLYFTITAVVVVCNFEIKQFSSYTLN